MSKDQKYDVSQHEGHTLGPWESDLDDEGNRWVDAYTDDGDNNICRITNGTRADAQLIANAPEILDALKEAYQLINKMQESIVKTMGECWVCGNFIDSCDSRTCERQMLEDIELGTASE